MNIPDEHRRRLEEILAENLSGAVLLDATVEFDDPDELAYVVLWRNYHEWGTHRACLSKVDEDAMTVHGHYARTFWEAVDEYRVRAGHAIAQGV